VVIPENLKKAKAEEPSPQGSLFSGLDMGQMLGYGAQWSQVVQLAQQGKKEEAVKKYMGFSSINESDARRTVEGLASSQVYEVNPGAGYINTGIAPIMSSYADTAKTVTKWSIGLSCGITAFVMLIIVVVVGFSLWAAYQSF